MITVDPGSALPPGEQIRAQIEALIKAGELAPDARLPSVRQLAADLRVAAGTVARAYKELEQAGLVRTGRAAGTRVNPGHALATPALPEADAFVAAARRAGLSLQEAQWTLASRWKG